MKSVVRFHFPQVVFEKQQKKLFNPVLKKRFKNRPEERVRLKWLEFLIHETDWNRNRISFESPVTVRHSENTLRADLILYSEDMKPHILIECKSDKVALTGKAGEQISRYNSDLKAPYLILTNGVVDLNYAIIDEGAKLIKQFFPSVTKPFERDIYYWSKRGFIGLSSSLEDQVFLSRFLNQLWDESLNSKIRYLDFRANHIQFSMDQYYRIFQVDIDTKLAISTVGQGSSESFLVAVLNQKGLNRAIVYVNLHRLFEKRSDAVLKFTESGEEVSEVKSDIFRYFMDDKISDFTDFSADVMKLF